MCIRDRYMTVMEQGEQDEVKMITDLVSHRYKGKPEQLVYAMVTVDFDFVKDTTWIIVDEELVDGNMRKYEFKCDDKFKFKNLETASSRGAMTAAVRRPTDRYFTQRGVRFFDPKSLKSRSTIRRNTDKIEFEEDERKKKMRRARTTRKWDTQKVINSMNKKRYGFTFGNGLQNWQKTCTYLDINQTRLK
eukprot:TRINITY_DN7275_c0_g1_i1.p1 TRINITY_DN7275_c0_g1~~TRINITY_DN7275_c0_g1_i1.p1  ORF type:complete len:190 (-),score=37.71 TRINITY_DN7275_c0_g1_i1:304-873(-)